MVQKRDSSMTSQGYKNIGADHSVYISQFHIDKSLSYFHVLITC